ncbi:MAG TPA: tetratricopeptide repeat protein [Rhizomicrobium sp.]|nr:tetratricopeptide repeat protein [Rhizomicrobium sp.]
MRSVLTEAVRLHRGGQVEQAAALYRKVLTVDPNSADALHLLGMIALQQGQAKTAAELIRKAIARNDREEPYHFHLALALQTLNDMQGAVASYRRALALKPNSPDSYNNMGNALAALDRPEDAVAAFRRALALQPGDAVAHNNLGNVQKSMGLWDDAEASFRKAVTLAPRETAAHCGLGATLWQLGRHDEALASYRAALSVDPDHAQTLVNLGIAREEQGALAEAEALYARALAVQPQNPDMLNHLTSVRLARGDGAGAIDALRRSLSIQETPWAKKLFVELARRFDWRGGGNDEIRRIMVRALTEPWDRPGALAHACAKLIRSHPAIGPLVMRADTAWSSDGNSRLSLTPTLAQLLGEAGFTPLADDSLLNALLVSAPNTDIPLERFLTMLRGAMMRELAHNPEASAQAQAFAAALAQQCFINDYVFASDADELAAAAVAARVIEEMADSVTPMQLLLAAAYFPLHRLVNAERLLQRSWPAPVEAVLTQQVREPLAELRLRAEIPRLTGIENPVSRLVQNQYEESPYPRWVRPAPETQDTIGNFLGSKFPFAQFERPAGRALPDILIAGCGTGQRSIAMARKFGAPNMLAVDLSLASLGYARRKSEELGLTIAYAQADILELERGTGGRQFDLIESLGVLHHLADPWAGWRALLSLLRPGGFMLLGLYSEMARRPVLTARTRIAELGLSGSAEDIRSFRQELIRSGDPSPYASILEAEDFFSLSACRDLLFHVQEQHITLPQIAHFTQSHNLRLLGFELDDAVLAAYRKRFPQDRAATDLACWEAFETEHPGLFGGMYIFCVQKPSGGANI